MNKFWLKLKKLTEVSLVDAGANQRAHIAIWKRAPETDMTKPFDVATLSPEAKVEFDALTKRATDAEAKVTELTPKPEPEDEIPAAIAKRIEDTEKRATDAEERIQKMEVEKRNEDAVRKVSAWKHLPIKATEFGPILRKIEDGLKLSADEQKELDRVLGAANEVARVGQLFEEIGSGADEGTAAAKVNKLAEDIRKADPKVTAAAARAQVYKNHPTLMTEVENEDRERQARR